MKLRERIHQTDEQIIGGLRKRISIQGCRKDMHVELAFVDGALFGIAMFAINLGKCVKPLPMGLPLKAYARIILP